MITDEQLIERLRSGMNAAAADVAPPHDLLDGISPATVRVLRLPSLSGLVVVCATASTIAVAVAAIILLGHGRTAVPRSVVPSAPSVTSADTLPELRSELAILRRPQLAADKLPAWGIAAEQRQNCSACLNVAKVMPRETRLLTTIRIPRSHAELGRGPERIYLVVGSVPRAWGDGRISGWRQRGRAIDGLHLSLVGITSKHSPSAQPIDEVLNSVSLPVPAQTLNPRVVIITEFATVGVVPDGVTRVKWELDNPGQGTPITVYPRVHGNVAITPWTPAPRSTSLINEQNLAGATWYGPDGRVIATFSVGSSLIDKAHSASGP